MLAGVHEILTVMLVKVCQEFDRGQRAVPPSLTGGDYKVRGLCCHPNLISSLTPRATQVL